MGERGGTSRVRSADLDRDHGLSGGTRGGAGSEEVVAPHHLFEVQQDRLDLRLFRHEADVVRGGKPDLVAHGNKVGRHQPPLGEDTVERDAQAARLGDDGDRSRLDRAEPVVGQGDGARRRGDITEAVGAAHGKAGLVDDRLEALRALAAFRVAAFAEAAGEDQGRARARSGGIRHQAEHEIGGQERQHVVGRLGQAGDGGKALGTPDIFPFRVHRIDRAGKPEALQVLVDAPGPVTRPVGSSHQDDVARPQQSAGVESVGHERITGPEGARRSSSSCRPGCVWREAGPGRCSHIPS